MIRNRKVLVVDRDPGVVSNICRELRKLGLETVFALDGIDALDRIAERPMPGLIVCDRDLDALSGSELIAAGIAADLDAQYVMFTDSGIPPCFKSPDRVKVFYKPDGLSAFYDYVRRITYRVA